MSGIDRTSAGILLYRSAESGIEVLLVHPGGPFWRTRWHGWWQIPKGAVLPGEDFLIAARREFREELGFAVEGDALPLGEVRQRGGKRVVGFACRGDLDPAMIVSNGFELEWPPASGCRVVFPEVDAARWFAPDQAMAAMLPSQRPLLEYLRDALGDAVRLEQRSR